MQPKTHKNYHYYSQAGMPMIEEIAGKHRFVIFTAKPYTHTHSDYEYDTSVEAEAAAVRYIDEKLAAPHTGAHAHTAGGG